METFQESELILKRRRGKKNILIRDQMQRLYVNTMDSQFSVKIIEIIEKVLISNLRHYWVSRTQL